MNKSERILTYLLIGLFFVFSACGEKKNITSKKPTFPPPIQQLINWKLMSERGWQNISFPNWFNADLVDSLQIKNIRLILTNYNFSNINLAVADTLPYQTIKVSFSSQGDVSRIIISELNMGIEIAEHIFTYSDSPNNLGYSVPIVSNINKYKDENAVLSFISTFQDLQQFQRLVLQKKDSLLIKYLDKNSKNQIYHYFIKDSSHWNVSFIDQYIHPKKEDIIYYGNPLDYLSSFSLHNLVEKTPIEKRDFYPSHVIKSQAFFFNDFKTKRFYTYDSLGYCIGFEDSLMTATGDFLRNEEIKVEYDGCLPQSISYYNKEDTAYQNPLRKIRLVYQYEEPS